MGMEFNIYKIPYRISPSRDPYEEKGKEIEYRIKRIEKKKESFMEKVIEKEKVKTLPPILFKAEEEKFELEDFGGKIVGDMFDRVRFLKERIKELEEAIKEREIMNRKFNEEIEKEIAEMERILPTISSKDELREFKLNLMMLRMEKRRENTNFWKDIVSLKKQLRELLEEYEIEQKISRILGGGNGGV